jgi:hypothetical protein
LKALEAMLRWNLFNQNHYINKVACIFVRKNYKDNALRKISSEMQFL